MRINVYGEELTDRLELVTKTVQEHDTDKPFTFYGVRFWLKFPNQPWWVHRKMESGEDDDDSSAVTFWTDNPERLAQLLYDAGDALTPHLTGWRS